MTIQQTCPIWGTPASVSENPITMVRTVDSPRAGGKFSMDRAAFDGAGFAYGMAQSKIALTTWLIDRRQSGETCPHVGNDLDLGTLPRPLPVHVRADRLLKYLEKKSPAIGNEVTCQTNSQNNSVFQEMLPWSESVSQSELLFLKDYLVERQWLDEPSKVIGAFSAVVTVEGYAHIADVVSLQKPSQGFVAMWFDGSMTEAFEKGIAPGIEDAGYKPLRIDKKEFLNKIDDEIIAEIRRSRFVVADFTADRGGVYYEAGFAHGLNIPVFFTCREDALKNIHFDTRQFPHIVWKDYTDLRKQLADRISAVIGDGPNKPPKAG